MIKKQGVNSVIIYHGSKQKIESPKFGVGSAKNDYGLGFYCTEDQNLAEEWAAMQSSDGFLNQYELHMTGLSVVNLESPTYKAIHWIALLVQNRTFLIDDFFQDDVQYLVEHFSIPAVKTCDIITGYRADDAYFRFAQDFITGNLSYENLAKSLRFGNLGIQIVVKSKLAFERLSFLSAQAVSSEDWSPKQKRRDSEARKEYQVIRRQEHKKLGLYLPQIVEERMSAHDPRL